MDSSNGVWLCLRWEFRGCGRRAKKHSLEHYQSVHHKLSINSKTLSIWWYKWDFDLIQEGLEVSVNSEAQTPELEKYTEHVRKMHDLLWNYISQKHVNGSDSNAGKTTTGSTGFRSTKEQINPSSRKN